MNWRAGGRRFLKYLALTIVTLVVALFAGVHIEQSVLRHRAERLFSDVLSLRVRSSTFAQAVDVFARWGRWGRWGMYDEPCNPQYCNFYIGIRDLGTLALPYQGWSETASDIYRLAGSRIVDVGASIQVRQGVVSYTDFTLVVDVPPFRNAEGRVISYPLYGHVSTIRRVEPFSLDFPTSHPEYQIEWPACTGCVDISIKYTPFAAKTELDRVARPNLNCITGWKQCRTKSDMFAGAMIQAVADEKKFGDYSHPECTQQSVRVVSRDGGEAAIVDIMENRADSECEGCRLVKVRLARRLKNAEFWHVGSEMSLGAVNTVALPPTNDISNVRPGSRVIIIFDRNLHPRGPVPILEEMCGVVPFTLDNLALVESGVREDTLVHLPEDLDTEPPPHKYSDPPLPPPPPFPK